MPWVSQNASCSTDSSPGAGRQPLDGGDRVAVGLHREHQARAHRHAVDQHRAGAADAVLAAGMRAGERELVAQAVEQGHARLDVDRVAVLPVDVELDLHARTRGVPRSAHRSIGAHRADASRATRRRYSADACRSAIGSMSASASVDGRADRLGRERCAGQRLLGDASSRSGTAVAAPTPIAARAQRAVRRRARPARPPTRRRNRSAAR